MATDGDSSGSGSQRMEDTSKILERLDLEDDEADDLVWEDEIDTNEIKPKWLALGRLLTVKSFSQSAGIGDMTAAGTPAQAVVWRRINAKLFSIQFNCLATGTRPCTRGPGTSMDLL